MTARQLIDEAFSRLWDTLEIPADVLCDAEQPLPIRPAVHPPLPGSLENLPQIVVGAESARKTELSLGRRLGAGGMGVVALARQNELDREVAIKFLRKERTGPEATWELLREACVTGLLEHPNIIPVYRLGRTPDGRPLLVMKKVEGRCWTELLSDDWRDARKQKLKQLPAAVFDRHLDILKSICHALSLAHSKSIVHRDLKPDNVMVGAFGEVYLVDWGAAVCLDPDPPELLRNPVHAGVVGTPGYMAPEMLKGSKHIDARTDVYQLGALLHKIVTGKARHTGVNLHEITYSVYCSDPFPYPSYVPAELAAICQRATEKLPEDRFADVSAFQEALAQFQIHRSSNELCAEAVRRLLQLKRAIDGAQPAASIHNLFAECRFGFQQALGTWPESRQAKKGLQSVLELMAEFELAAGADKAAGLLLAELPEPRPELEARMRALRATRTAEQEELRTLQKVRYEDDLEVGREARMPYAWAICIAWSLTPIFAPLVFDTRPQTYLAGAGLFLGSLFLGLWHGRRTVLQNRANRRLAGGILLLGLAMLVHRLIALSLQIPLPKAVALENLVYCLGLGILTLTLDRHFLYGAIAFLVAACVSAGFPQVVWLPWVAMGLANFVASLGLIFAFEACQTTQRVKGKLFELLQAEAATA